ncbi:hypothetical protein [Breoghania sp.]|uniref:hypothetical protein n=1 Tax=Breoghania sp. TaxID=2065378 RepID=UPI002AA71F3D|nr:hypothetical protein [Breoghania sp.]
MSRRPPIYCHIGIAKTGTSTLQQALTDHTAELDAAGFAYPRVGFLGEKGTAQHFISFAIARHKPKWVQRDIPSLEGFRDMLSQPEFENKRLIISSESFASPNYAKHCHKLKELFPDRDIYIVAYLRRPGEHQRSWYGQIIKNYPYEKMTFEHYAANSRFPFYTTLAGFIEEFGRERVIILDYDRRKELGGVAAMFCDAIGLDRDLLKVSVDLNVSPSGWHIELCRRLNHIGEGEIATNVRRLFNAETFRIDPTQAVFQEAGNKYNYDIFQSLDKIGVNHISDINRKDLYNEIKKFCNEGHDTAEYKYSEIVDSINVRYAKERKNWLNLENRNISVGSFVDGGAGPGKKT